MRFVLKIAYLVLLLVALTGALLVAFYGYVLWLMLSGQVQPGGPMFVDAVAPDSTRGAFIAFLIGLVPMVLALWGCWGIRQRLKGQAR